MYAVFNVFSMVDAGIDEITEDQIANERKEGILVWRGS